MATEEQKQELIDTLKFTPTTYTVTLCGYGGEIVMGEVERKVYDYFEENNIDLEEYVCDWDNEMDVPEDLQPFPPGEWHDCDGIAHEYGADLDGSSWIIVTNKDGDTVWESCLDRSDLERAGIEVDCNWETDLSDLEEGTVVFTGCSGEKGTFFDADIELTAPFDPSKLSITYSDVNGWQLCNGVAYDGIDLDNNGNGGTTGKTSSYEFEVL